MGRELPIIKRDSEWHLVWWLSGIQYPTFAETFEELTRHATTLVAVALECFSFHSLINNLLL